MCCFNSTSIIAVSLDIISSMASFALLLREYAIGRNDFVVQTRDGIVNDETGRKELNMYRKRNIELRNIIALDDSAISWNMYVSFVALCYLIIVIDIIYAIVVKYSI